MVSIAPEWVCLTTWEVGPRWPQADRPRWGQKVSSQGEAAVESWGTAAAAEAGEQRSPGGGESCACGSRERLAWLLLHLTRTHGSELQGVEQAWDFGLALRMGQMSSLRAREVWLLWAQQQLWTGTLWTGTLWTGQRSSPAKNKPC